jgi:large subunit ribosomal protein L19
MTIPILLAKADKASLKPDVPKFEIGDTVDVHVWIKEGDKRRIQVFSGIVIARRGRGISASFTVRRIVEGEGVERTFPVHSPAIAKVDVVRQALVRRAKLYFLRDRIGKQAVRLKERTSVTKSTGRKRTRVKARKLKKADSSDS